MHFSLPPAQLLIRSPPRPQVLELLSHVTKRLRAATTVKVPFAELLAMRSEGNPAQLGFITVFLGLAFDRLSPDAKAAVAPALLDRLHMFPNTHKAVCLKLFLKVRPWLTGGVLAPGHRPPSPQPPHTGFTVPCHVCPYAAPGGGRDLWCHTSVLMSL